MSSHERVRLAAQAAETLVILQEQVYETDDGTVVDLTEALATMRARQKTWCAPTLPTLPTLPTRNRGGQAPPLTVVTCATSLSAAWTWRDENPLVLNFASATRPGGGWQSGASTQEESLCRATALYAALEEWEVYALHDARRDPLGVSAVQYVPQVPLLRDVHGRLVSDPPHCAFVSCAAVNFAALRGRSTPPLREALRVMAERIAAVIAVAILQGHRTLVAGAWGAGAFGGDPTQLAELWRAALHDPAGISLERVVFPIPDAWTAQAFETVLSQPLRVTRMR